MANNDEALLAAAEAVRVPTYVVIPAVGVPMLFILLAILLIFYKRRPRLTAEDLRDPFKRK